MYVRVLNAQRLRNPAYHLVGTKSDGRKNDIKEFQSKG